jgi:hypothetical protein
VGNTGIICNGGCVEGSLNLPAGAYAISAKIELHQGDVDQEHLFTECTLSAGGGSDRSRVHVLPSDVPEATLPLQLVRNLPSGGTASVSCRDADIGDVRGEQLKITGVELGSAP